MKIGLARRGYSATGGAEKYLLRLAQELMRGGHEVVLFSDVTWPSDVMLLEDRAMEQVRIPSRGPVSFARGVQRVLSQRPCDQLLSLERLFACDIYRAGDGVHSAWLERRARFEPPWKRFLRWANPKHRRLIQLERALFTGGARRVIANSQMVKREIVSHYGYPEDRIDVVYNGIPPNNSPASARAEVRAELGLQPEDYVALFVGSGWERKGLRFAWNAAWKVDGLRLLIAGKGRITLKPHLQPAPGGHPYESIPQRFLGSRSDVGRLLAASDVFILPTIYDPFSNACLEALAAGLPVITTEANGFAELMEAGIHGTVIQDPAEESALAAALQQWKSVEIRQATRQARLARAAEYTMERNLRETLAAIRCLEGS